MAETIPVIVFCPRLISFLSTMRRLNSSRILLRIVSLPVDDAQWYC